jgi:hypothetical protein
MHGSLEGVQHAPFEDGIVRVHHINHIEGYIFRAQILWGAEWNGQSYDPDGFSSFAVEDIEGLHRLFELLSIIDHLSKGRQEKDFGLPAIVDENFGDVSSVDVDGDDHSIGMWEQR